MTALKNKGLPVYFILAFLSIKNVKFSILAINKLRKLLVLKINQNVCSIVDKPPAPEFFTVRGEAEAGAGNAGGGASGVLDPGKNSSHRGTTSGKHGGLGSNQSSGQ